MSEQSAFDLIESPKSVAFPCMRMRQPIGNVFVGVMDHRTLHDITFFDIRERVQGKGDELDTYMGIQRILSRRRVEDLGKYVRYYDATFPSSIILAVEADCVTFSDSKNQMILSNVIRDTLETSIIFRKIARVLDGQHRIEGLNIYVGDNFDLSVTIFVGRDLAEQAHIFSIVNLEQTKVQRSLAYDLYALAKSRSPLRTCHNVVVTLDNDPSSAFYERIKRLGTATEGRFNETLTQATFVESLLRYVSSDPKGDRDALLRGRRLPLATAVELEVVPLRNLFIQDQDIDIIKIMWNYFAAVRGRWPHAWNFGGRGLILNKTNGFRALMQVFRPAYLYKGKPGQIVTSDAFGELLGRCSLSDNDFNVDRFPPGTSGEVALRNTLMTEMGLRR